MIIEQVHFVYFSPTGTTKKVLETMEKVVDGEVVKHDFTPFHVKYEKESFVPQDVLVIGFPVFSGRVPAIFTEHMEFLEGDNTPAIIVAAYGNRDYDDALMEMKSLLKSRNFIPVTAAAFVTEHNMYPAAGAGRPDDNDLREISEFTYRSFDLINAADSFVNCGLQVKGNADYRDYLLTPMQPHSTEKCSQCGVCANICPAGAIPLDAPQNTDNEKCIRCMRCVRSCPVQARQLSEYQKIGAEKHLSKYTEYRRNEFFYINVGQICIANGTQI